ncbi:MAG: hypothetical protein GXX79_11765 [Actinomycetales bacterium]|nr:hypothetical protein [Actinomycetales bacterium]
MEHPPPGGDEQATAVIVDLDGTLADVGPVEHLVARRGGARRDFAAFHRYACTEAAPVAHVADAVRRAVGVAGDPGHPGEAERRGRRHRPGRDPGHRMTPAPERGTR